MSDHGERRTGFPKTAVLYALVFMVLNAFAGHQQSAVDPAGPQSGKIATLWWFFVALLGAIFVIVTIFTLLSLMRRHRGIEEEPSNHDTVPPNKPSES
ncbi:MAG: hypothetical protein ACR2IV_22465 [Bryobacteraceae bacterium]